MDNTILIIGSPRSGTTWVGGVFGLSQPSEIVTEPDNEKSSCLASRFKRHLPRFPTLAPTDDDPRFALLWDYAVRGRFARGLSRGVPTWPLRLAKRSTERAVAAKELACLEGGGLPRPEPALTSMDRRLFSLRRHSPVRVIKTVHSAFCAEWVVRQAAPTHVVVILRHPYGAIASLRRMGMDDAFRPGSSWPHLTKTEQDVTREALLQRRQPVSLRQIALQALKMCQRLQEAWSRNPHWIVIRFEELCEAPQERFRSLFDQVGCEWNHAVEAGIAAMNQPGSGYQVKRVASEQIDRWKREFTTSEMAMLNEMFGPYLAGVQNSAAHVSASAPGNRRPHN